MNFGRVNMGYMPYMLYTLVSMVKQEKFSNLAHAVVALSSIFEYYRMVTQNFVNKIVVYAKIIIFETLKGKLLQIETLQKMQQVFRNILNTVHNTVQYIPLVTMNMCFGLVIIFLIVKHVLQNINIYKPKYYTVTIF